VRRGEPQVHRVLKPRSLGKPGRAEGWKASDAQPRLSDACRKNAGKIPLIPAPALSRRDPLRPRISGWSPEAARLFRMDCPRRRPFRTPCQSQHNHRGRRPEHICISTFIYGNTYLNSHAARAGIVSLRSQRRMERFPASPRDQPRVCSTFVGAEWDFLYANSFLYIQTHASALVRSGGI
jgi:hypothetical protein